MSEKSGEAMPVVDERLCQYSEAECKEHIAMIISSLKFQLELSTEIIPLLNRFHYWASNAVCSSINGQILYMIDIIIKDANLKFENPGRFLQNIALSADCELYDGLYATWLISELNNDIFRLCDADLCQEKYFIDKNEDPTNGFYELCHGYCWEKLEKNDEKALKYYSDSAKLGNTWGAKYCAKVAIKIHGGMNSRGHYYAITAAECFCQLGEYNIARYWVEDYYNNTPHAEQLPRFFRLNFEKIYPNGVPFQLPEIPIE